MLPAQTAHNITQDYSAYIINLSTIHTVAPIFKVIDNFAKLHYDYANSGCTLNGIANFGSV